MSSERTATASPTAGPTRATPTARRRLLLHGLTVLGVLGDVAAVNLAMVLAYWLRFRSGWIPVTKGEPLTLDAYLRAMIAITAVWLVIFARLDMYRPQRWTRALDEAYRVLIATGAVLLVVMALSFLYRSFEYSRLTVAIAFVIAAALGSLLRAAGLRLATGLRRRPELRQRVAVLAAPEVAERLARDERRVVYQSADPTTAPAEIHRLLAEGQVDLVVLTRQGLAETAVIELLLACEAAGAEAVFLAERLDLLLRRGSPEDAAGLLIRVRAAPLDGLQRAVKRLGDILGAGLLLLLFGPLMAIIALLVKLTSPGPVFYRQTRLTEGGREFAMIKFRSMTADAEAGTGAVWARPGDPRTTPLGRLLRRTSLDELPQLWNVLVGDMSLIGPRPERPVFVAEFAAQLPRYEDRHRMKTGLTGWAQVNGQRGGDSAIEERTRYDLYYVDNWSLMLDLEILVKTLFEVLFHRGAG